MIPSLLLANRGKIACRIIRTAQRALLADPSQPSLTP
jgi:acetyl/propionyl-CoA carboxylase alpha subunit